MTKTPEAVVRSFYGAWLRREFRPAAAYCAEDVRITQHFIDQGRPFSATTRGRDALERRLVQVASSLHIVEAVLVVVAAEGAALTTLTSHKTRRLRDGTVYDGILRQAWIVGDGLIDELDVHVGPEGLKAMLEPAPAIARSQSGAIVWS